MKYILISIISIILSGCDDKHLDAQQNCYLGVEYTIQEFNLKNHAVNYDQLNRVYAQCDEL